MKKGLAQTQTAYMPAKKRKDQQRMLPFLFVFLLLGAVGFFLEGMTPPTRKHGPAATSASSPEAEALVNKHLFLTSQDKYLREKKIDAENSYLAPQIGDSIWPVVVPKKDLGIDHSPDRNENSAFQDLNRYPKEYRGTNPDQVIQGQLVDEDLIRKTEWEDRKEYARQFVENARRNGYLIRLNEDLVVIGVSPLGGAAR